MLPRRSRPDLHRSGCSPTRVRRGWVLPHSIASVRGPRAEKHRSVRAASLDGKRRWICQQAQKRRCFQRCRRRKHVRSKPPSCPRAFHFVPNGARTVTRAFTFVPIDLTVVPRLITVSRRVVYDWLVRLSSIDQSNIPLPDAIREDAASQATVAQCHPEPSLPEFCTGPRGS